MMDKTERPAGEKPASRLRLGLNIAIWVIAGAAGLVEAFFVWIYVRGMAELSGLEAGAELYPREDVLTAGAFAVLWAPVVLTLLSGAAVYTVYCVKRRRRERENGLSDARGGKSVPGRGHTEKGRRRRRAH